MKTKTILLSTLAAAGAMFAAGTAQAQLLSATHTHYCNCGHTAGSSTCGTSSGGTTTTSGGTTTTSGGTTTTSGGTSVPEPGMLGIMSLGLLGVGLARRRKARA